MTAPPKAPSPALLAKGALVRLNEARQEPTPENFQRAYLAECEAQGVAGPIAPAPTVTPSAPPDSGPQWAALIGKMNRGLERSHRQWTTARKKDSLQRVLAGSAQSAERLLQRLSQLVGSWDSDSADTAALSDDPQAGDAAPAPQSTTATNTRPANDTATTIALPPDTGWALQALVNALEHALPLAEPAAAEARLLLQQRVNAVLAPPPPPPNAPQPDAWRAELLAACDQASRVIEHRQHLGEQLVDLCRALTDSLVDLAEEDSWVQGQCTAMRAELDEGLNHRGTRRVHQLLDDTRQRQRSLRQERDTARQALKQLIQQMLGEMGAMGELGQATGRFQSHLVQYADTIGRADSLESLTTAVREMVAESRAVHDVVTQAQQKLHSEHAKALALSDQVQRLEDEIRQLSAEVSTDPLTQIANRRGLMRAFEAERARTERQGATLSVGLLDVDNFKKLNDTLGHQTGDEALQFLARRVAQSLRPTDVVARYGGEEFVVLLPDTPVDEAQATVTRLQRQLSAEFFTHDDQKVFITFSAGVTPYREGEAIEATLDRADMALYEAKRTGKNRTCIA